MLKDALKRLTSSPKRLILAGVFCLLLIAGLVAAQAVRAQGRILPNVSIGGLDVGGLRPDQAKERLERARRALNVAGVQFRHQGTALLTVRLGEPEAPAANSAAASYDLDGMVEEAFAFGHNGGAFSLALANVRAFFTEVEIPARILLDRDGLREALEARTDTFADLKKPAKDASFIVSRESSAANLPIISGVEPASAGVSFEYDEAIDQAANALERWQSGAIELRTTVRQPAIATHEAEAQLENARKAAARGEAVLAYDDLAWKISPADVAEGLTLVKNADGAVRLTLKRETLGPLLDAAAKEIEAEPAPTSFRMGEDGRAKDFVGGTVGKKIDRDASIDRINEQFSASENGVFPLVVATSPSPASAPLAEELGIRELIGYGTSNFAGSPRNRRTNIANGAARLNGLIIKPGEEVGLIEFLKPFDASGGYVPELVIKGSRTVPEYGGGLCQIGTTVFRATMGAGLPITQRQNHSFRVRYYEPAGTDATLYDPAPDFKFINDTGHHVVLITKIIGDIARFEFWGTRDGRVQEQSAIKTWNITPPPEPKLIETSELPEGQKKCFESPHAGATTEFTYSVTYPDGTVKAQDFRSVYKPWQQQCLIGKAGAPRIVLGRDGAITELPPLPSATSTPETTGAI